MIETKKLRYKKTLFICFFSFILLGFLVSATSILERIDLLGLKAVSKNENNFLLNLSKLLDYLGSVWAYILITLIILAFAIKKNRKDYTKLYIKTAIITGISIQVLKLIYDRARPVDFFKIEESSMSFPSGHSMGAMSLYLLISYIVSKENKKNKKMTYTIALLGVLLMGWSRLYLGVHWPSDVIAGYLGGICIFIVSINIYEERIKKTS